MQKTILIATNRKTGKDVILSGSEAGYPAQRDQYREFTSDVHEEYSHVGLYNLIPVKKPLKLISKSEQDARAKKFAQQTKPSAPAAPELTPEEIADQADEEKTPEGNEFKRADLLTQDQGKLLTLVKTLAAAGRLELPTKTSKPQLIKAILLANPITPESKAITT